MKLSSSLAITNKVHGLLHKVLADDLKDFVLLESLTGNVQRKIFGDDTLDEVEVLGNEVLTVSRQLVVAPSLTKPHKSMLQPRIFLSSYHPQKHS
jgi:hypothetical protein